METSESNRGPGVPRIALIGCGAIARSFHLPALVRDAAVKDSLCLVDTVPERTRALGAEFGIERVARDYREVIDTIDAAVITVPHSLHYPIARDLLDRGVHVLCEKPLTETAEEARNLIRRAEEAGVVLAANYTKRLYPSFQKVRELIQAGAIGAPQSFEFLWGEVFDWPAASGFYFGKVAEGRGVLFDKGPHVLDALCWWLPGEARVLRCDDDSFGGSEAVCEVEIEFGSCRGKVALSWLSRYENTFTIRGEKGSIQGHVFDWRNLEFLPADGDRQRIRSGRGARRPSGFGPVVIDDFLSAIETASTPLIPATAVLDSIRLIEESYRIRERFSMPWHAVVKNDA